MQRSYINPFPNGDRYRVVVLGDSLGDGLWSGLYRAFEEDKTLEFIQHAKPNSGFARTDSYDWNEELAKLLKTTPTRSPSSCSAPTMPRAFAAARTG